MTKQCFKCRRVKDLGSFYIHKEMADGHLNKCKECTKTDVARRYYDPTSRERIIKYEKARFQRPERRRKIAEYQRKMRELNPEKVKARRMAYKLEAGPCAVCGSTITEAHHDDYSKPLDVIWFCRKHHMEHEGKVPF